jgi:hypothetical protein
MSKTPLISVDKHMKMRIEDSIHENRVVGKFRFDPADVAII